MTASELSADQASTDERQRTMGKMEGKTAVITGASRGLGRAMALAFAEEGANVVIAARSEGEIAELAAEIQDRGGHATAVACDVGRYEQVIQLAERAIAEYNRFDVWINNAGISPAYGPTWQVPMERFEATLRTNIHGVLHGSWIAVNHMLEAGGVLINLLGAGARGLSPNQNAYGSSKSWVRQFTLTLAKELEGKPIRVIAFNPGLVYTDLVREVEVLPGSEGRFGAFERVLALLSNPPEIPARKAVWLASDDAAGVGPEVSQRGRLGMLWDAVRRGIPMLLGRSQRQYPVHVHPIEPASSPLKTANQTDEPEG